MSPARLSDLHRERAALQRRLAAVDEQIAAELTPREEAPPKTPRPPYVPAAPVSERDRAAAARVLRGRGYEVRVPSGAVKGDKGGR